MLFLTFFALSVVFAQNCVTNSVNSTFSIVAPKCNLLVKSCTDSKGYITTTTFDDLTGIQYTGDGYYFAKTVNQNKAICDSLTGFFKINTNGCNCQPIGEIQADGCSLQGEACYGYFNNAMCEAKFPLVIGTDSILYSYWVRVFDPVSKNWVINFAEQKADIKRAAILGVTQLSQMGVLKC
jgi:hypothetical protein